MPRDRKIICYLTHIAKFEGFDVTYLSFERLTINKIIILKGNP
jgi:hypothetical protein